MPEPVTMNRGSAEVPSKPRAKQELDSSGFLNLFTQMLTHQSPWEPMKDGEVFTQMSQFTLTKSLSEAAQAFRTGQGASLIGKTIEAMPLNHQAKPGQKEPDPIRGVVESVQNQNGSMFLNVRNTEGQVIKVKMSEWKEVSMPQSAQKTSLNEIAQSTSLVGKTVTFMPPKEDVSPKDKGNQTSSEEKKPVPVHGVVEGVHKQNGTWILNIKNTEGKIVDVKMSELMKVSKT